MYRAVLRGSAALAVTLPLVFAANAQLFRAYASIDGNDANPCTITLPCRLLPAALAAVAPGGEVWLLDSANFNTGPVAITKSVTILAVPGALGSVVALGGNAIDIATPGIAVTLRNLNILPFPGNDGYRGINVAPVASGSRLFVQGCSVSDFAAGWGMNVSSLARVVIIDSLFRNNYTAVELDIAVTGLISRTHLVGGSYGLRSTSLQDVATVTVFRAVAARNIRGLTVERSAGKSRMFVTHSVIQGNQDWGGRAISASAVGQELSTLSVSNSLVVGNGLGLGTSQADSRVISHGNTVSRNGYGLRNEGGAFISSGNNSVSGNTTETAGTITTVPTL